MTTPENKRPSEPHTDHHAGETSDRLRHEIDNGAGDKVAFSDPAAAPLGTDDEAAGTPPDPAQIARARAAETARPTTAETAERAADRRTIPARQGGIPRAPLWMIGAAVVVVLLLVFAIA
ncbi:hypothetical protein [Halodurantibacterium flavum]|uniref:Uncharacterized protein n=1 Tax=Halodurantibacterium flavum TaxID=1382802 RepID=A0ABW4S688_9RHOB